MAEPRFAKLDVKAEFQLLCDPKSSIYNDIDRDYEMTIFALVGEVDDENWEVATEVGSLTATLFRFDAALNLGVEPAFTADAHSMVAEEIYSLLEQDIERGEIGQGMHLNTVLLHSIQLRDDLKGTKVEHEAIRTALMGLSSGVSRAFLQLDAPEMDSAVKRNHAALRYAPLGFKPVGIGSDLLWIDLEARAFWEG